MLLTLNTSEKYCPAEVSVKTALAKLFAGGAEHLNLQKWILLVKSGNNRLIVAGRRRGIPDHFLFLLGVIDQR